MKAVVLQDHHKLAVETLPDPEISDPGDVLVEVSMAAICGSDLHARHGLIPGLGPGTVIGHEFVGQICEAGAHVRRFKPGDRVAAPAAAFCGTCPACRRKQVQYCPNGGIFGGGDILGKGLAGAQAEKVRIPYADACLTPIPDTVSDRQALFVGDILSTGFSAASQGRIRAGDTVVVFGCGPVGLSAVASSWLFGPSQVFAVDTLPFRLDMAARFGAVPVRAGQPDLARTIAQATQGQGADVAIEAAGSPDAFARALEVVRHGGQVSVVGLFAQAVTLPIHELAFHGVGITMGLGNLSHMDPLMALVEKGVIDLTPLATHEVGLDAALEGYDLFENQKDACIKVLINI